MTLILTRQQMLQVWPVLSGRRIDPRLTADGKLGVSEAVLTDPKMSSYAATLAAGTTETVTAWSTQTDPVMMVNGKQMTINSSRRPYSISEPAADVFRFEMRANDAGTRTDLSNGNRRVEIVSLPGEGYTAGQTLWMSWTTILGTQHNGMKLTDDATRFGYVMQVHPINLTRPLAPVVCVNYAQNLVRIMTASDAEVSESVAGYGVQKVRWSGAMPAAGVSTHFVLAVTFGESGHLTAWVNGSQVYDASIPIGFWTNGGIQGYPQWGVYEKNHNTTEVVYAANIEWGASSLAARAASPLAVPDLSPWA